MPGPLVGIGAAVILAPGPAGVPDSGIITTITPPVITYGGLPVAKVGSICQMINSVTGAPYNLPIPPLGASTSVTVAGAGLVRMGDVLTLGSATLTIVGPPLFTMVPPGLSFNDLSP